MTILANAVTAIVYSLSLGLAIYILVRYLLGQNRRQMIVFYLLIMLDLTTRVVYYSISCFYYQTDLAPGIVQEISTIFSVFVGISHSNNMGCLIFDLTSIKCLRQEDFENLTKKKTVFVCLLLFFWTLVVIGYIVAVSLDEKRQ